MKGTFETKEHASAFVGPLNSLSKIIEEGVVLNVSSTDKTVSIYALNGTLGTMAHVTFKDIFKNFTIDQDEKIGVINLQQMVKYFNVLDQEKVALQFENNVFSLANSYGNLSWKTADPEMIKESPKNFKGSTWYASLPVDEKAFSSLLKGMSALASEDCVLVKGDKATGKVSFNVRASGIEINSFKVEVSTPVDTDFETFYRKDVFERVLATPCDSITLSFIDRLVRVECKSKYYDIVYYVAKKTTK